MINKKNFDFKRISRLINEYVKKKKIPGAVFGVININKKKSIISDGYRQLINKKIKVNNATTFDLASLTKVLFTTHQILKLHSKKILNINDLVSLYIPDFCQYDYNSWERKVTIKECLSHHTNFPAVEPIYTYGNDPDTLRAFILQRRWKKNKSVYSDINFILLGIVLERIYKKNITKIPTGYNFSFNPLSKNIAATEICKWRNRIICGETHDENAFALKGSGHAGLFGNADSILNFAFDMLNNNNISIEHSKLIKNKIYKNRSCGWEVSYKNWSGGNYCSKETIGHTGFTGTGLWIDFKNKLAWTLLTNRVHPSRHTNSGIQELRSKVGDLVIQDCSL